jgi:hypothetical protein
MPPALAKGSDLFEDRFFFLNSETYKTDGIGYRTEAQNTSYPKISFARIVRNNSLAKP